MEPGQQVVMSQEVLDGLRVGDMWRLSVTVHVATIQAHVVFYDKVSDPDIRYYFCVKELHGDTWSSSADDLILAGAEPAGVATYLGTWEDLDRRNGIFTPAEQAVILSMPDVNLKLQGKIGVLLISNNLNALRALHALRL